LIGGEGVFFAYASFEVFRHGIFLFQNGENIAQLGDRKLR
jgi:hypothetical protein